ncbi:hypothetical protein SCP_0113710 [Sparassis crispa]|uniref:Pseudouridine synthase RsuA/RluA-like domain-containing protein n=1 Tax=Sparassis crispa TaxID=139825 RepID=A0A401G8J6_9APHY|nr:hypothetical protein SCP_0113710 [Sparassis crispa]GBE78482.1 hypothetical protein SCP_0113710 [Sparassis crispa]
MSLRLSSYYIRSSIHNFHKGRAVVIYKVAQATSDDLENGLRPPLGHSAENYPRRVYLPHISLPDNEVFWHVLAHFLMATMDMPGAKNGVTIAETKQEPRLKKIPPYWYAYTTMAKARWLGREVLEVVSTEFRDRSMEYYRYALESGVVTVNGKVSKPDTIICNGDRLESVVHKHEPPVSTKPVRIILQDNEKEIIVIDKPGSIPIHACGRYHRNSLIEILKSDFGFEKVYPVNRLDRLTSGLMIIPISASRANLLAQEFAAGTVRKEYVARCRGRFPVDEITCEQPLLTVDRQIGLTIVHPEGKPAKTVFKLIRYDFNTDTSVVRCKPFTGRSHQIRVHLQYLGHPIANDIIYSDTKIWGENVGKGGLDLTPSEDRAAPQAPSHFTFEGSLSPESLSGEEPLATALDAQLNNSTGTGNNIQPDCTATGMDGEKLETTGPRRKLLPRETGHDIGMASPVPLSAEMVGIITRLRNMKDEDEDWSRWRDVVFRGKAALAPHGVFAPLPPQNRRRKGGPAKLPTPDDTGIKASSNTKPEDKNLEPVQLTQQEALAKLACFQPSTPPVTLSPSGSSSVATLHCVTPEPTLLPVDDLVSPADAPKQALYCRECYLPLHPDPKPDRLYIFLHALRYTTNLGCFETEMPDWAAEGWVWDR